MRLFLTSLFFILISPCYSTQLDSTDPDILVYYPMNEVSGDYWSSTTKLGSVKMQNRNITSVTGIHGNCGSFNGSTSSGTIPDVANFSVINNALTFVCSIKTTTKNGVIFGKGYQFPTVQYEITFYEGAAGKFGLYIWKLDGGGSCIAIDPATISIIDGKWHRIGFSCPKYVAGGIVKIYVDGNKDTSAAYSATAPSDGVGTANIGNNWANLIFNGNIEDVALYQKDFSDSDWKRDYYDWLSRRSEGNEEDN